MLEFGVGRAQAVNKGGDNVPQSEEAAAFRSVFKKSARGQITDAASKLVDVQSLLPDPPLPGAKDLQRWWPDGAPPAPLRPGQVLRPHSARRPASSRPSPRQSPRQFHSTSRQPAGFDAPGASTNFAGKGGFARADYSSKVTEAVKASTAALTSKDSTGVERVAAQMLERAALENAVEPADQPSGTRAVLANWMATYEHSEESFASKAVFVEMRLRQALACAATLGTPNNFRCAIVCDAWDRVAPLTGRFEGLFQLLWTELLRSLYADYTDDLIGSGAKEYAARTPFFTEVNRLRRSEESSQAKIRLWQQQRETEMAVLNERNKSINHTLSAWNRALGYTSGAKAAAAQRDQLASNLHDLASHLTQANDEADRLSRLAFTEPLQKWCASRCAIPQPDSSPRSDPRPRLCTCSLARALPFSPLSLCTCAAPVSMPSRSSRQRISARRSGSTSSADRAPPS